MKVIYTDEFWHIVSQAQSKYKIVLQGSYEYRNYSKSYAYKIENIEPEIPLSTFHSKEFLFAGQIAQHFIGHIFDADVLFRLKYDVWLGSVRTHQRPLAIDTEKYKPYFEHFENALRIDDKTVTLQNLPFLIEFYFAQKNVGTLYVLHAFELFLTHKQKSNE